MPIKERKEILGGVHQILWQVGVVLFGLFELLKLAKHLYLLLLAGS